MATKCEQCGNNQYLDKGTMSDCISCSAGKEPDLSNCLFHLNKTSSKNAKKNEQKNKTKTNKTKTKTRRQLQAGAGCRVAAVG